MDSSCASVAEILICPKNFQSLEKVKSWLKLSHNQPQGLRGRDRLVHCGARTEGEHGGEGRPPDGDGHGGGLARRPRAAVVLQDSLAIGVREQGGGVLRGEEDRRSQSGLHRLHHQRRRPGMRKSSFDHLRYHNECNISLVIIT